MCLCHLSLNWSISLSIITLEELRFCRVLGEKNKLAQTCLKIAQTRQKSKTRQKLAKTCQQTKLSDLPLTASGVGLYSKTCHNLSVWKKKLSWTCQNNVCWKKLPKNMPWLASHSKLDKLRFFLLSVFICLNLIFGLVYDWDNTLDLFTLPFLVLLYCLISQHKPLGLWALKGAFFNMHSVSQGTILSNWSF